MLDGENLPAKHVRQREERPVHRDLGAVCGQCGHLPLAETGCIHHGGDHLVVDTEGQLVHAGDFEGPVLDGGQRLEALPDE